MISIVNLNINNIKSELYYMDNSDIISFLQDNEIISYLIIGFISMVIGIVCINIILSKDQRDKFNNLKNYLIFFFGGIIVHMIVQTINLDDIYCGKQCQMRLSKK
jgi:H+/Cl- antiporter ClcA